MQAKRAWVEMIGRMTDGLVRLPTRGSPVHPRLSTRGGAGNVEGHGARPPNASRHRNRQDLRPDDTPADIPVLGWPSTG